LIGRDPTRAPDRAHTANQRVGRRLNAQGPLTVMSVPCRVR